jgi:Putative prokaryotic signal transducing protein
MSKEDDEDWVEVASTGDDEEAVLIAGLLDSEGIPVEIEGPSSTPFPEGIGALGLSRVMVPPDRADEAKAILAAHSQDPGPELSDTADE